MNNYSLTLVLKPELDEKQRGEVLDQVSKQLEKMEKNDLWGVRALAYPIDHKDKGFYAHFEFQSDPGNISSLDKNIKLNEDIIRYLLIRK